MTCSPSCNRYDRFVLLAAALASCSSPSEPSPVGREIVTGLVDDVYLPAMEELAVRMPGLVTATEALCAAPDDARLATARSAWRTVRVPWKHLEAMAVGPVMALRIEAELDFWPARAADIEAELALTTPIDDSYLAGLGATRKGLPVIEYLLFGALDRLTGTTGPRTCAYLTALARRAADRASALVAAWRPSAGNFRAELVDAGAGSTMYSSLGAAINATGNALIFAVENAEGLKLAKPLGRRDGGTPQPDTVESRFADNARADLLDTLAGARAVYTSTYAGSSSPRSFSSFVRSRDAALDAEVLAQIAACEAIIMAWALPLDELVVISPEPAVTAFDCTKQLLAVLKADVAALLGVTPTFGDVDGD
jgi:predicted lipoprotein